VEVTPPAFAGNVTRSGGPAPFIASRPLNRRVTRLADHLLIRGVVRRACPSRTGLPREILSSLKGWGCFRRPPFRVIRLVRPGVMSTGVRAACLCGCSRGGGGAGLQADWWLQDFGAVDAGRGRLSRVGVQSGRKLGIEQVDGGAHRSLRARLQPAASALPRPAPRTARSSTALPSHVPAILIGACRLSNVAAAHRGNEYTVVLLITPHVRFRTIRRARAYGRGPIRCWRPLRSNGAHRIWATAALTRWNGCLG
jgi:hypothetical protein